MMMGKPIGKANLGETTWQGDQWKIGGATQWGRISYDPELNLIYYGTSNPGTGTPTSAQETTNGRPRSSLATLTAGRQSGSIR